MNIKNKRIAPMLAIAFGLLMAIPTMGMLTAQAAGSSEIILVESNQVHDLQSMGAQILVDYANGRYLMKMPSSDISRVMASGMHIDRISNHRYLDLYPSSYKFNPVKSLPTLPQNLMTGYNSGERGEYLVQFIGPVKSEWVNKVRDAGATVYRDVAQYGMLVKMTPETASTVRSLPEVAWVGIYQPAYKIPAGFDINSDKNSLISVVLYKDASSEKVADELNSLGITVMDVMERKVIISAPNNMLPEIAKLPDVEFMEKSGIERPLDLHADRVIHARELWYPVYNGLGDRFIGYGQVVGIQDTGFDNGESGNSKHPTDNDHILGPLGNRVIRYHDQGGSSDPDGENIGVAHGSHCCGLIAGNGYSWEKQYGYSTSDYNWDHAESVGVAPGAKLSADGIVTSSGNGYGIQPKASYWDTEQADGAQIYSNSWGAASSDYGSSATDVDDKSNADNRRLFLFAASNSGPARDTLSPDSQGKNGICVAASENFRPSEWFDSSDSNDIVFFSSRGGTFSDTRIKPDLAAPGTSDISLNAKGEYDYEMKNGGPDPAWIKGVDQYDWDNETDKPDGKPDYQYMQGTSMACPVAAGAAAVVRGFLVNTSYSPDPTSQIVKGLLINGASRMPNILYPGYDQGWGRINLKNSLIPDPPTILQYTEGNLSSTGTWDAASDGGMHLDVESGDVPLKVTLTWVDTSGKDLNRDLDLNVTDPNGNWYIGNAYGTDGWTVPNKNVSQTADTFIGKWSRADGYDGVNNVEQVEVQNPTAGTWTVHVIGANVPSQTNFSVVIRADIGSLQPTYSIKTDLLSAEKTIRVDQGGTATVPIKITNFGMASDTIQMSDNLPSGITSTYTVGGNAQTSFSLSAKESTTLVMTIHADTSTSAGIYDFSLTAASSHDTNIKSITDMKVEVVDQSVKIPHTEPVADNATVNEMYPSVTTFTDHNGVPWIFVAYLKPYPISSDGKYGGDTVMVKYAQLGSDGMPQTWHGPIRLTNLNEYPNDIRITHATSDSSDSYQDRVWVIWTGTDPNSSADAEGFTKGSWGRIAWADNSDYSSWTCPATGTNTTIDENSGSQTYNSKRVNSIQERYNSTRGGMDLVYIFEHLDYDSSDNIKAVHDGFTLSQDGGSTWSKAEDIDPGGDYFFFPNVMDGGNDYNNVVWMYVYHRASSGNDRDLSCQVYDDNGWGSDTNGATKDTDVLDNPNNLMFPVVAYDKSSGSANHVFFAVLNDTSGTYQINTGYYPNGAVSSSNPPADTDNAWGTVQGPFATSVADVDYSTRPVLNMISTPDDGGMWVQYLERATPLGNNIRTIYSTDGFSSVSYHDITANSYPKGHQMSSTVNISGTDYVYTVYHMSKGEYDDTNYDVYLSVYHAGFENDPDIYAPEILRSVATPAVYESDGYYHVNLTANPSFEIATTVDDADQGRSTISSAEWSEDGSTWKSMTLSGSTVVEKASIILRPSWCKDSTHTIYIRATDSAGNTRTKSLSFYVDAPPQVTVNFQQGWNLVSLPWLKTSTNLTEALNGISWDRAMVYTDGLWKTYNANRDAKFNIGFPGLDNSMGIWVHTTAAGSITHDLCGMSTYQMNLHKGWNLVGYVSQTTRTVSDAMAGFTGNYDAVQTFNGTSIVNATNMELGQGYWIHVTSEGTWSVDW